MRIPMHLLLIILVPILAAYGSSPQPLTKIVKVLDGTISVPGHYDVVTIHKGKVECNERLVPSKLLSKSCATIMLYIGNDPPFTACSKKDSQQYTGQFGKKRMTFYKYTDTIYGKESYGHLISQACGCIGKEPCYCQICTEEISASSKVIYNNGPVIFISIDAPTEKALNDSMALLLSYKPRA